MAFGCQICSESCYVGVMPDRFYQYTVLEEASREHFIYPYCEQSHFSSIDFVKRAIAYFASRPETIQTDKGFEFAYPKDYERVDSFDLLW